MRPPLAGPPTVAFAGQAGVEKGADLLVRAFARGQEDVPDARLLIAGDGPERPRLDALARAARASATPSSSRGALERDALEDAARPPPGSRRCRGAGSSPSATRARRR